MPPKIERKGSHASVWIFAGDGRKDVERRLSGWVKVVGPIDQEIASGVCNALKEFFSKNGVTVFEEGIAD
jgi:hypothetical protein